VCSSDLAGDRLPATTDRHQLAHFVLTTMEGGIMQARAARDLALYDAAVAQLRAHFEALQTAAALAPPTDQSHTRDEA